MSSSDNHRVALVTGAARRIGRHIALDLAAHGWRVALHYHASIEAAEEAVGAIRAAGGTAEAFAADLDAESEVRGLMPRVSAALGPVSLLVNNASIFEPDSLASLDDPAAGMWKYHEHFQVNLTAPLLLTRALVVQLPAGLEGNVVNILDQKVWRLTPYFFSYTLSKAALWTATQTLAQALAPQVRVNAIGPGPILPNARQSDEEFARQCASLPLQRCAAPDEIAAAIRFLVATPSLTGQMIALDGGRHLAWRTPDVTNKHD
jgi:NAD(P)-dependent dehydrogenase (short-subunit alcohol dehydrogenase family)